MTVKGGGSSCLLLGDDGRGYELARRLEGCGAWRAWLGDAAYSSFLHYLSSPAAWEAFIMSKASSTAATTINSNNHQMLVLHLQLRARALLFDKASISLFLSSSSSSSSSISHLDLNPQYLQLHGDDIFCTLEQQQDDDDDDDEHGHPQAQSRAVYKANEHPHGVGSRCNESDNANISQRYSREELPETWYSQYFDKLKARYHKFPHGDKESLKRTSEGMSTYLQLREMHKRKRQAFNEEQHIGTGDPMSENGSFMPPKTVQDVNGSTEDDISFFPEIMFSSNCVPDSSLPLRNEVEKNQKLDVYGILDNLPTVVSRSTAMMERFGIRPNYIRVGNKYRGIDGSGCEKKPLCQEQASLMTHKIVARLLANAGFDGGTGISMEVFSEFFSSHICKLGRILKLLTDSYKKQFSSVELLQMFLQTAGFNNLGVLIESTKDGNKGIITQTPQHVRAVQSHQNSLLQAQAAQQLQRQIHPQPQMNMLHSPNLSFQQQQQQLRRRQATTPRGSVMMMDKDQQPMVDVKIENSMESTQIDPAAFNALNKQQQMQFRQQQLQQHLQQQQMTMGNHHAAQSGQQQFRQLQSAQIPQLQVQNPYGMRTAPVKVEAFHELMGGDSTLKHDPDHNKLTPPPK